MPPYQSPSTVTAHYKKNRLYIKLRGTIPKKDAEKIYTDIRFCVCDLKPGFAVITDLTEATIGHLTGIDIYKKIVQYLAEKKVGPVIRVVGQGKVIFQQLSKLTQLFNSYETKYVKSIEEAEALLEELFKDDCNTD